MNAVPNTADPGSRVTVSLPALIMSLEDAFSQ